MLMSETTEAQAKQKAVEEMGKLNERNLSRQVANARPMPIVSGPVGPAINGIARPVVGEDRDLLDKTKTVRRKGEKLLEFFARTGIGAHQVHTLPRRDLERLVAVKLANADDVREPKRTPIPGHLEVTFDASGDLDGQYSKQLRLPGNMVEVGA